MWNTNIPSGWKIYKELTENNSKFDEIASSDCSDPNLLAKKMEKELTLIKYESFGKVQIKKKKNGLMKKSRRKKGRCDRDDLTGSDKNSQSVDNILNTDFNCQNYPYAIAVVKR